MRWVGAFPSLPRTCGLSSVLREPPCTGLWLPVLNLIQICAVSYSPTPPWKGGKEENNSWEWIGVGCDLYTCWQQIPRLVLATQVEQMEQIDKTMFTHAVLKKQLSCCLKLKVWVWFYFPPCSGISGSIIEPIALALCSSTRQLMKELMCLASISWRRGEGGRESRSNMGNVSF